MRRLAILLGSLMLLAILIATGWYFVSPLFVNRTINEASPFVFPSKSEVGMILPPPGTMAEKTAARLMPTRPAGIKAATAIIGGVDSSADSDTESDTEQATLPTATALPVLLPTLTPTPAPTATPNAPAITLAPMTIGRGNFVDGDAFHKGSGVATIYAALDGSYVLRFENFKTTNGPDLHVLLSPNAAPVDRVTLGRYLDLGDIKGNVGNQNYTLPASFDPAKYKSVVIYCVPFRVIFATATLEAQ